MRMKIRSKRVDSEETKSDILKLERNSPSGGIGKRRSAADERRLEDRKDRRKDKD